MITDESSIPKIRPYWFTRDDVNFVYIPIYRCATYWLTSLLKDVGFYEVPPDTVLNKERLVIIREPTERVLSGMVITGCSLDVLQNTSDQVSFEEMLNQDMHTSSQLEYLPTDESTKYVYFKFGEDLPKNINRYMSKQGITLPNSTSTWLRRKEFGQFKGIAWPVGWLSKENREKVYRDPKLLNKFRMYLKDDYKVYDSITWFE
jgi:hypothetical protein